MVDRLGHYLQKHPDSSNVVRQVSEFAAANPAANAIVFSTCFSVAFMAARFNIAPAFLERPVSIIGNLSICPS